MREPNRKLSRSLPEFGESSERRATEQDLRARMIKDLFSFPPTKPDPPKKSLYTGDAAGFHAGPRSEV